jgi:Rieske Fe-S protein
MLLINRSPRNVTKPACGRSCEIKPEPNVRPLNPITNMQTSPILTRKTFIKTFALSVAQSALMGRSWSHAVASEIHAEASTINSLRVRLQDFPALQNESGSVRIGINPIKDITGPNGTFYPVTINRGPNATFFAMSSRCMHQGCIVEPLDPSSIEMTCFCHGSVYGIDGKRISGPTPSSLTKYSITFDGSDLLKVQVTGLAYSMTVASVEPITPGSRRLKLTFRSFRNVDYEVQFRQNLTSAPTSVPFSLTATGPADQIVYTARSATATNFFVESDSPAGFYTVAIRVREV